MAKAAKKKNLPEGDRLIAQNRRARHEFELGKSFESGVVLIGSEARALREGPADITDAWVEVKRNEAYVQGMRVPPLSHSFQGHDEKRPRKLLLHRNQIDELMSAQDQDRMTLVATKLYFKGGRVKLELCVAKGKKEYDKRQTLRTRTADKEARIAISNQRKAY
jgi:SsrA-binding protein